VPEPHQQWRVVLVWTEPDGFETTALCMPFIPIGIGQVGAIDRACACFNVDLAACTAVSVTAIGDPCEAA
jgi:hypothetical protein